MKMVGLPAFKDNYIWLQHDAKKAIVVDPGDAEPVLDYLQSNKIGLEAVLLTHHHHDHTGGVRELKKAFTDAIIYAPRNDASKIAVFDKTVSGGDQITLSFSEFIVLDIPGHTLGHIAYVGENKLFCGDTLFSAGCGRVFEGTMVQMYQSLSRLKALDNEIEMYCGHEYTYANLLFAKTVEPNNLFLQKRLQEVIHLREKNQATLPVKMGIEKMTNPFLRCDSAEIVTSVKQHVGLENPTPVEVFSCLRAWKNKFSI
ncbi:hydroxyacylglutathione hydrolase [Gammaproteobacteria bacterium SCGC AG-212-F23]|nr:hydroxyacylglutathione hydrolase [Gammaproteobacteria bacterium SCGC AG-212-F23]